MTIIVQLETNKGKYPLERRLLRYRGPRLLQWLLTPPLAPIGMLFFAEKMRAVA